MMETYNQEHTQQHYGVMFEKLAMKPGDTYSSFIDKIVVTYGRADSGNLEKFDDRARRKIATQFYKGLMKGRDDGIKTAFKSVVLDNLYNYKDKDLDSFVKMMKDAVSCQEAMNMELNPGTSTHTKVEMSKLTCSSCNGNPKRHRKGCPTLTRTAKVAEASSSYTSDDDSSSDVPPWPTDSVDSYDVDEVVRWEKYIMKIMTDKLCFNCKETGHFYRECPHPKNPSEGFYRQGKFRNRTQSGNYNNQNKPSTSQAQSDDNSKTPNKPSTSQNISVDRDDINEALTFTDNMTETQKLEKVTAYLRKWNINQKNL